ncbi:hypothetical protein TRFO_08172 [Tritrichomonas foetus]|uniref:Uncharacterized protein n=1 Tax=Tritrichomonas foetus TaxID=1144522 RepID=A0A1J4JME9_9EUKA|nr:hypothetical protein TRFO_08172 [Tritrichomonas foetus]|eukprot:OHS99873.1 hypothetical protein TRFO_08172 [Tritrichomonas foetus]
MSILSPGGDAGADAPPPQQSRYGGLRSNNKARNRRDKVKFFDSADWAMRNQNQQGAQGQGADQGNLPTANFQNMPDQGADDGQSNSFLANESNADAGGSVLAGGDADGQSPLSGSPLT